VALAFFIVLLGAALTSALSLLEVITAYFVDEFALSRVRAAILSMRITSLTCYL
jgi:NSS family neurotransmitter:Na+ symporter